MDSRRQTKNVLIACVMFAASGVIALEAGSRLQAARWLPVERQAHALTYEPSECLPINLDENTARLIAIGRAAFRTPLLLGGQAARAGLSCNSCHSNGRGNSDFLFAGLSGAPGTADVSSSLMSSHRGDGVVNPTLIPDLSGPENLRKISHDKNNQKLEIFIRGLIVEEFDGPEPSKMTLDGLATYVRMLSPSACKIPAEQRIILANYFADVGNAMHAAQFALDNNDHSTARLMIASARSALGMINERYSSDKLNNHRRLLHDADLELASIENAIDSKADDISLRIITWQTKMPRWSKTLERDEALSLFNPQNLATKP